MPNSTEKLAAYFLAALIAPGIYFNADNEKRLEQQIEDGVDIVTFKNFIGISS